MAPSGPRIDAEGAARAAERAEKREAQRAEAERQRLVRIGFNTDCVHAAVSQAIEAEAAEDPDDARSEALDERLMAYLEDPREEDAIADTPVSAQIARVCKDLGLAVDWSLWEDEDWAVTEWRDAVRGSPYAPGGAGAVAAGASLVDGEPPGSDGTQGAALWAQAHDPPEGRSA